MSGLERAAEDLIARAKRNPEPQFVSLKGWRFALSYGEVETPPTREEFAIGQTTKLFERVGVPIVHDLSYEQFVEFWKSNQAKRKAQGLVDRRWVFSAQLVPVGRSSETKDWNVLGRMCGLVGAPKDSCITPLDKTHPNAVHYWMWTDEAKN